jgi:hypothetical protein
MPKVLIYKLVFVKFGWSQLFHWLIQVILRENSKMKF